MRENDLGMNRPPLICGGFQEGRGSGQLLCCDRCLLPLFFDVFYLYVGNVAYRTWKLYSRSTRVKPGVGPETEPVNTRSKAFEIENNRLFFYLLLPRSGSRSSERVMSIIEIFTPVAWTVIQGFFTWRPRWCRAVPVLVSGAGSIKSLTSLVLEPNSCFFLWIRNSHYVRGLIVVWYCITLSLYQLVLCVV